MDLRRLRLFLLLAEEKNFHRAAEKAYLSQPALSQQIKALEKALGIRLLERRPFRLTPAGEVLKQEGKPRAPAPTSRWLTACSTSWPRPSNSTTISSPSAPRGSRRP